MFFDNNDANSNACLSLFREPIPVISHFNILGLGFKPENFENDLKVFISSLIDFWLFKKMLCHLCTQYISSYD